MKIKNSKIHTINMKGLYFAKEMPYSELNQKPTINKIYKPNASSSLGYKYIEDNNINNKIKKIFKNNESIKNLSKNGDVFIRLAEKGRWANGYNTFIQIWHINQDKTILNEYRTSAENTVSQELATKNCLDTLSDFAFTPNKTSSLYIGKENKQQTLLNKLLNFIENMFK